jgi:hypothetical protein
MADAPMRIDAETRPYVRVAMRDTLEAYDLSDLLDLMADICQQNAEASRTGGRMGLPAPDWQSRADMLREAAQRLDETSGRLNRGDSAVTDGHD